VRRIFEDVIYFAIRAHVNSGFDLGDAMLIPEHFGRDDVDIQEESAVYTGFFRILKYRLRHRLYGGGWNAAISRELFQRGEAAAAVLYDPQSDCIGLIEQFRIGALGSEFGPWCLEGVAGMFEPGEDAESLLRRELLEEAGIGEATLVPISSYYSTPGGCAEKIHLYCALCSLDGKEGIYGLEEEGEDIRLHVFPAQRVFDNMLNDRTNNAATLIGLLWLQIHRSHLRETYLGH